MIELRCPLDGGSISESPEGMACRRCSASFPLVDTGQRQVPDFRCRGVSTDISLTFTIPQTPLRTGSVERFGAATAAGFACPSRETIRKRYGTKLQKEILYYIDMLAGQAGKGAVILDLGCGSGGNKKYLESIGFHNVVPVDFMSPGADYLVDAHRLPFAPETFDMVLTTATLEHFYNPYIAYTEMARVLKPGGMLIATGSFWDKWHSDSCFHCTPGGIDLLCRFAGLELCDMWSGWGFIPSVCSHALGLEKFKRATYMLQKFFDCAVTRFAGRAACKKHRFRTSGSFGLFARKAARS